MSPISRRAFLAAGAAIAGGAAASPLWLASGLAAPYRASLVAPAPTLPWPAANEIVANTKVPTFPDRNFSVLDYGARGDNSTDNTDAFARAIAAASAAGGGHVIVPSGTYVTGAVYLKSNVDFKLQGATLKFSGTASRFPIVLTRYEGIECMNRSPMIYAYGETNIALTGTGTLDAAGTSSWNKGNDRAWLETQVSKPPQQRVVPGSGHTMRSTFVEPYNCDTVLIQGITLKNSMFWQFHPTLCKNVTIDNVNTDPSTAHSNTDGVDPESCDHVVIRNSNLGAHDDNVAIKSGRDTDGRRINVPCQNLVVFDCIMNGNWGAITCGSEQTGGIRNVYAYRCSLVGATKYALYVKSNTRRGGFSENINLDSFSGVLERSVAFVNPVYNGQTGSFPPRFGPFSITNSTCTRAGRKAFDVSGLSSSHVHGFTVRNCDFRGVSDTSNVFSNVDGLVLVNVKINGKQIGDPPTPEPGNRYEAENATITAGVVESNHAGHSGSGFVNFDNAVGSAVQFAVSVAAAGTATLRFRYANGTTTNRPLSINVNGAVVNAGLAFNGTGAWTTWQTASITAPLVAGANTVKVTATTANGGPNLDYLEVATG